MDRTIRVRFAPSPTGYLHIGGARSVLFNWLVARKMGGVLVLRIEDTDRTRHVEDSVQKILDDLRWLGLLWNEGPEVGGDYGPYFQSERLDLYRKYLQQLLEAGKAYYALETPEELAAMRAEAEKKHGGFRYPRPHPLPTVAQGEAARSEGRRVVVRFKMPNEDITVVDDILGKVTLAADQHEDFVIQKSDGFPTYHFACVIDDELMKITHVLRGQEHLMNTPKHIALQRALGFSTPHFGHMPVIFNMDGSKMSKRDKEKALKSGEAPPEIDVHDFRVAGYLPEAVVNFIALLGWNPGDEREQFSLDELATVFSIERVGKTNARFDRRKLLAFNTDWAARVSGNRLLSAFKDFLTVNAQAAPHRKPHTSVGPTFESVTGERVARVPHPVAQRGVGDGPNGADHSPGAGELIYQPTGQPPTDAELRAVLSACAGFRTFPDVLKKAGFLFTPDEAIEYDPKAVKKVLQKNDGAGFAMLEHLLPGLESLHNWTADAIEGLLKKACEERGVGMGNVAQPIRVAVTGSTISPGIGVSLEMLGRDCTLGRVRRCVGRRATG